jgi:hypothetical protein
MFTKLKSLTRYLGNSKQKQMNAQEIKGNRNVRKILTCIRIFWNYQKMCHSWNKNQRFGGCVSLMFSRRWLKRITPYSLVDIQQRFGGTCCLHLLLTWSGGCRLPWNVGEYPPDYKALHSHCLVSETSAFSLAASSPEKMLMNLLVVKAWNLK